MPNFRYIVDCYLKGKCGDQWRKYNENSDYMKWVNGRIFTYGDSPHMCVFDDDYLKKCLVANGFINVRKLDKPRGYDHGKINLGMGGVK